MLAPLGEERRAAGSQALVLLGAACVLGVVAFYSFEHSPASIPGPALALYVPTPAGLRPVATLPGSLTVQEGPPAAAFTPVVGGSPEAAQLPPAAMMPIPDEAPVALPSVMISTPADSPGMQPPPIGQPYVYSVPPVVQPIKEEGLSGPLQMLLWGVAAGSVMGVAITRKRIYDRKRALLDGVEDTLERGVGRTGVPTMMAGARDAAGTSTAMPPTVSRAPPPVMMVDEPSEKAMVIGAAAVGGILGVYLFHELSTGVILASVFAYAATTQSKFGNFTKKSGEVAAKVWDKSTQLNEQYDVLQKTKSAIDTVVVVGDNLNTNYGITAKIDEQLKLSEATDKITAKIGEVKSSVTYKVDDLKAKASTDTSD